VGNGARLTIEPGVVFKFKPGAALSVANATLSAIGGPENPIIETGIIFLDPASPIFTNSIRQNRSAEHAGSQLLRRMP